MKNLLLVMLMVCALFTGGCQTSRRLVMSSSTTVDHAMQAWAMWVVDGKATPAQEAAVRQAHAKYIAAEDLALAALDADKATWLEAKRFLLEHQAALLSLIEMFKGKATP